MTTNAVEKPNTMPLDKAREVIWPFREIRGQSIGALWDKGALSFQDLGYAIAHSYDKRVREAARTLLISSLTQEQENLATSVGPLNVFSSERRSFTERRQLQFAVLAGLVAGFILAMSIFFAGALLKNSIERNSEPESNLPELLGTTGGQIAMVIVILGFIAIYYAGFKILAWLMDWPVRQVVRHRKGQLGEERVLNAMYRLLDGEWWAFRNLEFPGTKLGDIDLILVGPNGVWSLEVKSFSGTYRNVGDNWERRWRGRWIPAFVNPTEQAKANARKLSQFLTAQQIKQWVTPMVIWADTDSSLTVNSPSIMVWKLDELSEYLKSLHNERPISQDQRQRILKTLEKAFKDYAQE